MLQAWSSWTQLVEIDYITDYRNVVCCGYYQYQPWQYSRGNAHQCLALHDVRDVSVVSSRYNRLRAFSLWGITCTQTYDYFMDNTDDRLQRSIVRITENPKTALLIDESWCRWLYFGGLRLRLGCCFCAHVYCNRAIDTFSSAMHSHMAYYYLVTCYTAPSGLQKAIWQVREKYNVPWSLTCT